MVSRMVAALSEKSGNKKSAVHGGRRSFYFPTDKLLLPVEEFKS